MAPLSHLPALATICKWVQLCYNWYVIRGTASSPLFAQPFSWIWVPLLFHWTRTIDPSFQVSRQKYQRWKLFSCWLKRDSRRELCPYWSKKNTFEIQEKGQITVGGFFINANSKNGCNTFSDSIFVNWLQRYSIFGQITRMKQFPFWRKKPPQHLMPLLYLLIYEKYYSGKLISTHCANGCVVASFGEKFNKHFDLGLGFEWVFKHWQRVDIIN